MRTRILTPLLILILTSCAQDSWDLSKLGGDLKPGVKQALTVWGEDFGSSYILRFKEAGLTGRLEGYWTPGPTHKIALDREAMKTTTSIGCEDVGLQERVYWVSLHELGHYRGYGHVEDYSMIMHPSIPCGGKLPEGEGR